MARVRSCTFGWCHSFLLIHTRVLFPFLIHPPAGVALCWSPVSPPPGGCWNGDGGEWLARGGLWRARGCLGAALQYGRPQRGSWWGINEIYVTQGSTPPLGKSPRTCQLLNPLLAARDLPKVDQRPGLKATSMSSQQSLDKATCLSFPLMSTLPQQDQIYVDEEDLQKGGCSLGLIKAGQSLDFSCHVSNPQAGDKGWDLHLLPSPRKLRTLWVGIMRFICFALRIFCWRLRRVLLNDFSPIHPLWKVFRNEAKAKVSLFPVRSTGVPAWVGGTRCCRINRGPGGGLAPLEFCQWLQERQDLPPPTHRNCSDMSKKMH